MPAAADEPAAQPADAPAVLTERRGDVLLITINRPEVRNAVNAAVAAGIGDALDLLDAGDEPVHHPERGFAGITRKAARKPLIAAIEGFAVAGGLEVALACDLLVAARGAKLGIPEVKRSLVAAGGALLRLPQRVPYHVAMELALTGDPIRADRAAELGIVNRVVEPGETVDAALKLAETIAANGPLALEATKRILVEAPGWP